MVLHNIPKLDIHCILTVTFKSRTHFNHQDQKIWVPFRNERIGHATKVTLLYIQFVGLVNKHSLSRQLLTQGWALPGVLGVKYPDPFYSGIWYFLIIGIQHTDMPITGKGIIKGDLWSNSWINSFLFKLLTWVVFGNISYFHLAYFSFLLLFFIYYYLIFGFLFKFLFLWSDLWSNPWSSSVRSEPIPILSMPPEVHIFALETQYFSCCLLRFNE